MKRAVRRVLSICETLWQLPADEYRRLLAATDAVDMPSRTEAEARAAAAMAEDAGEEAVRCAADDIMLEELKRRYAEAAEKAGFERRHGLAMLEYATMLMDIGSEEENDEPQY